MPKRVVVWDLDETLVLFHSLINQEYARANPCCPGVEAHALGEKWQDAILDLADEQFFYREVRLPPFKTHYAHYLGGANLEELWI